MILLRSLLISTIIYCVHGGDKSCGCKKPPKCPTHEVWVECPKTCPPNTCHSLTAQYKCRLPQPPLDCKPACMCEKGYLRDTKGVCIPQNQCPKPHSCEGIHEQYNTCGPRHQDSCDNRTSDVLDCVPGCFCEEGYIRDSYVVCIKKTECISCNGDPNARPGCGNPCGKRCSDIDKPIGGCPEFCRDDGCDCLYRYVLDTNTNRCVRPEDCSHTCKAFEIYDKCGPTCEDACDKRVDKADCREKCVAGCFCEDGYIRDENGRCIKLGECKSCNNDPNAHPGCENHCGNSCDTYNRTDYGCSGGCLDAGCVCNKGYVYDWNIKKCVKPEQCTPVCSTYEVYDKCGPTCQDACDKRANPANCRDKCVSGCFCKEGFIRDNKGKCVKPDQCISCNGDPNARPGCGSPCRPKCSTYNRTDIACKAPCIFEGCDCIEGYIFDDKTDKCVKPKDCTPTCGPNEKYDTCGPTCEDSCDKRANPWDCRKKCVKGCFCVEGYLRDNKGKCIKPEDCKSCNGDPHAHPGCEDHCNTCENYNRTDIGCVAGCGPLGCPCNKGYVLDTKVQKCVLPEKCTPRCGKNEEFVLCGPTCEDSCNKRISWVKCRDKCIAGCFCKKDYIRDDFGRCIKLEDCKSCNYDPHARPGCENYCGNSCDTYNRTDFACGQGCRDAGCVCNKGYVYDYYIKECVLPQECSNKQECCGDRNATCVDDPKSCEPTCLEPNPSEDCHDDCDECGCRCKKGYILNTATETCIRPRDCPKICGGDKNAEVVSCPEPCPETCQNRNPPKHCLMLCKEYGCQCKPGFILDEVTKKCVKPEKCPPKCGEHEIYKKCGSPCEESCDLIPTNCPDKSCKAGCFCVRGYVRHFSGKCVERPECTKCDGDENAVLVKCPEPCPVTCQEPNPPKHCHKHCKDFGCECRKGYVFDEFTKKCVKPKQCHQAPLCVGNQTWVKCARTCPPDSCESMWTRYNCPQPQPPVDCKPACWCADGYLRNKVTHNCILIEECLLH